MELCSVECRSPTLLYLCNTITCSTFALSTSSLFHLDNAPKALPFKHVVKRLVDVGEGNLVSYKFLQLQLLPINVQGRTEKACQAAFFLVHLKTDRLGSTDDGSSNNTV